MKDTLSFRGVKNGQPGEMGSKEGSAKVLLSKRETGRINDIATIIKTYLKFISNIRRSTGYKDNFLVQV